MSKYFIFLLRSLRSVVNAFSNRLKAIALTKCIRTLHTFKECNNTLNTNQKNQMTGLPSARLSLLN
jgi:hypothetical protein